MTGSTPVRFGVQEKKNGMMSGVTNGNRQLGVLGLGHVGLPTALGFAELGFSVLGTDSDSAKVQMIGRGQAPFYEPEMGELLRKHLASGRFRPVASLDETVRLADILFICVGTPHTEEGAADLSQVESAVRTVAESLNGYKLIVEKSTAPVHTARWIQRTILRYHGDNQKFDIACNPEFLREGTAMHDVLHPDRVVVGVESARAKAWLEGVYRPLQCPILFTDLNTAEIIKHTANAFLSMKISFINMVSDLCEAADADVKDVARGIGLDPRIGPHFLQAGVGYGGFCFPKDLNAFVHVATECGVDFSLLKEVKNVNDARIDRVLRKVQKALWVLKDKRLAVWGLAFKPHTDDIREAPSLKIVKRLQEAGCLLSLYDPQAVDEFQKVFPADGERLRYCSSPEEAAAGAHAILLVTEWPEFAAIDWKRLRTRVALPLVVDGRNCLDPAGLEAAGFEYYGMGRPVCSPGS